ncbi:MAG: acyl-CoA carboxylase subunit epsilon [Actinomycetota bacterium]|nr:acyl-CoA carboxylase subunit epsilon [Actinomycetota bacterium]
MSSRDDEDVAAVIAVLAAIASGTAEPVAAQGRSPWAAPTHRLAAPQPGPRSWWASGQPR